MSTTSEEIITDTFLDDIGQRLESNRRVRRALPHRGRLHIDRQLPFLFIYRRPVLHEERGTDRLVTGQASWLVAEGTAQQQPTINALVERIVSVLSPLFGGFLLVEIWTPSSLSATDSASALPLRPAFRVVVPKKRAPAKAAQALAIALKEVQIDGICASVESAEATRLAPPGLPPLLDAKQRDRENVWRIGIEVDPVYFDRECDTLYPQVLNEMQRAVTLALKRCVYAFACESTTLRPQHFHALGRHTSTRAVHDVDERLATIGGSFDLLLQVTPVNAVDAWNDFRKEKYAHPPRFIYRPSPVDPELLKRGLFNIPIEQVEDPTLAYLFRERQEELDHQITMLRERGNDRFLHAGILLYGGVEPELTSTARELMENLPASDRAEEATAVYSDEEFARLAEEELAWYRTVYPSIASGVEIRDDVAPGLIVSSGCLLVGRGTRIPRHRADALLQHEVGTHVLTWCNGRAQPLAQLYHGLAGYEAFQEGIAVLAEYLVGGLTRSRLRLLAGRVIAVTSMIDGATFIETHAMLMQSYGFSGRTAFTIAMRVYRGGGLVKDAIYLRGLQSILGYLRDGGEIDPLFVGKIAAHHVPVIQELRLRNVLIPAPLIPRYLTRPEVRSRLLQVCSGLTVHQLVENTTETGK